jgi:hypothetical protein
MWPRFLLGETMKIERGAFRTRKERGEWAELYFMARAAAQGLRVSRPFGDSSSYDVGVECGDRILRVQVKSTMHRRRDTGYFNINLHGCTQKQYAPGSVDFFAAYLIPIDTWYIIPFEKTGKSLYLSFATEGRREKHWEYREAWDLLKG